MRIVVKIKLNGRLILKFFLLFVSVLVDINELSRDLNLDSFLTVERNVNVVSMFESGLFVIGANDNLIRRHQLLVTL